MLVALVARVVGIGCVVSVVSQIEDGVHSVASVAREGVIIVFQRALGFYHKVGIVDALVFLVLAFHEREVGKHCQSTYWCSLQECLVLGIDVACLANVLHDNGESRRASATKDTADEENAVAVGKDIGKGLEFVAVLHAVERHAAYVGRAHKANAHLVLQLIVGKE